MIVAARFQFLLVTVISVGHTLRSRIRWTMTRLHATIKVSIELEKVCV